MQTRKTLLVKETVHGEAGRTASAPVSRVAAIAVIANPFAGRFVDDLSPLFDIGMQLGEQLMPAAVALLDGKPMSYGKAAIVGVNGDGEHAAAVLKKAQEIDDIERGMYPFVRQFKSLQRAIAKFNRI